jgi:hypothetical protein
MSPLKHWTSSASTGCDLMACQTGAAVFQSQVNTVATKNVCVGIAYRQDTVPRTCFCFGAVSSKFKALRTLVKSSCSAFSCSLDVYMLWLWRVSTAPTAKGGFTCETCLRLGLTAKRKEKSFLFQPVFSLLSFLSASRSLQSERKRLCASLLNLVGARLDNGRTRVLTRRSNAARQFQLHSISIS